MTPHDLCALGAATLPTHALVRMLVRRPMPTDEADAAVRALTLVGRPREAACRALRCGPQLLAAVELGRRAWMIPSPAGRRVSGPADVVSMMAPRMTDDSEGSAWVVALDVRLTVACVDRIATASDAWAGGVLRSVLAAGASRAVLVQRRRGPAAATTLDIHTLQEVLAAAHMVDVDILDQVLVGDDGFCSLMRLGLMPADHLPDGRYR